MSEEIIANAAEEIKNASEDELKSVIESWYERTRTQGMKIGASYISAAIFGAIQKHVRMKQNPSLRDYKRMTDDIVRIISVQLTRQDDGAEEAAVEETANE